MDNVNIALLRGINVGGRNKLPMKALVPIFEAAGCQGVRTYIQSGNVVFSAPSPAGQRVPEKVAAAILEQFGLRVPVILRTASELGAILHTNPFLGVDPGGRSLHVAFLADQPTPENIAQLDPSRSPPDEFAVIGREIYLRFPNGTARSKFTTTYFDTRLGTTSTVRNWRTVLNLAEMSAA